MIFNVINETILAIKLKIAKVGYIPLLKKKILSKIPSKYGGRNKRRFLRKNVI
jgi:hypothetical protein